MNDLTIIIPPHNRHIYLKRVLELFSTLQVKILIGDSSNIEFADREKLGSNIHYFYYKNYSFVDKMFELLKMVDTEYVLIVAEDDFYFTDAIQKCLNFLKKNRDYASCQGNYTCFQLVNNDIKHYPIYLNSINRDINAVSPEDRLIQLFSSYFQLFYCLHRTKTLYDVFKFSKGNINSMFTIEMLLAMNGLLAGKHKVLPIYYGVREYILTSVGRTQDNFYTISNDNRYKVEYNNFLRFISSRLSDCESISYEIAKKKIENILDIYFSQYYPRNLWPKVKNKVKSIIISKIRSGNQDRKWINIMRQIPGYPYYSIEDTEKWIKTKELIIKYHNN